MPQPCVIEKVANHAGTPAEPPGSAGVVALGAQLYRMIGRLDRDNLTFPCEFA